MIYDDVKYKRESKLPEKDFIAYTLTEMPVEVMGLKKAYPRGTLAVVGDMRKDGVLKVGKVQSVLIPRSREEIWKIVEKRDIFWKMATYEKEEITYGAEGIPCFDDFKFRIFGAPIKTEGRCEPDYNGNAKILLGDKYFELSIGERAHVLRHETGHVWEHSLSIDEKIRLQNSNIFGSGDGKGHYIGNFGTYNMDEAMAESFSYYIGSDEERNFFKEKYPEAYKYVKESTKRFRWLK